MAHSILDSRLPIVAAPMAGGPSTVALARAVASAGAFPFLAGGYKTADALAAEIEQLRSLEAGFGVNLFAPSCATIDAAAFAAYADEVQPEADSYGLTLDRSPVVNDDDSWADKLALLIERPVPVVSVTFGLPDRRAVAALQSVGTRVLASVTSPEEAILARDAGVDGLVVQGSAAGGHSATFDGTRTPEPTDTATLVARVRRLLAAGAQGVAVGTYLLRTDEAGTSPTHRAALADPRFTETTITRAFTGRPARALRNGFVDRHPRGLDAYPAVHHLTRELRQAASRAGDADRAHLWAGTGFRDAPTGPAAEAIKHLAAGSASRGL